MVGWFGDLGRLYWGLLYWNTRKSLFRLRGASGRAPCQHPSDSGEAGKTGCEACLGWRKVGRFRRLCPLVVTSPDGSRVCSVAAAQVRPFWGRAAATIGVSAALLAAASVLAAFAGLRAIGYRVPLRVVAWPPAWHQIRQVRADYFYRLGVRAFGSGDMRQSYLALNQAYALDPHNFAADRLLAELAQIGNPDFSDTLYARLLAEDRGHLDDTGQAWIRALIERGDFLMAANVAGRMLQSQAARAPAWAQAMLFAERMTGDPGPIDRLLASKEELPQGVRSVLSLARSLRSGNPGEREKLVRLHGSGTLTPFEAYYALNRLVELGRASEVSAYVESGAGSLDPYDREALKLDAYSSLGWGLLVRKEIGGLLERGPSVAAISLISAHLIRHPDAESAEFLFQQLDLHPIPVASEYAGPRLALLCVAGVNGLEQRMREQGEAEAKIVGGSFPAWLRIRDFFEGATRGGNPASIMPALGMLPLDTIYAVYEHYRSLEALAGRGAKAAPR
jgi:tetratricopeptide (TPR) repeat protein